MKDIPYASAVGSFMYSLVCTRHDISFVVGMLGRYQSNPGLDHWKAAKKVLRYLQGTKDYMLTYKRSDDLEIIGYSDSDFAGCVRFTEINFRIQIYVTRQSFILEKFKTDSSYYFYYEG